MYKIEVISQSFLTSVLQIIAFINCTSAVGLRLTKRDTDVQESYVQPSTEAS